jgi:hypothetical protein
MMANILSIPIEAPTDGTGVVENIPIRSSYLPLIKITIFKIYLLTPLRQIPLEFHVIQFLKSYLYNNLNL